MLKLCCDSACFVGKTRFTLAFIFLKALHFIFICNNFTKLLILSSVNTLLSQWKTFFYLSCDFPTTEETQHSSAERLKHDWRKWVTIRKPFHSEPIRHTVTSQHRERASSLFTFSLTGLSLFFSLYRWWMVLWLFFSVGFLEVEEGNLFRKKILASFLTGKVALSARFVSQHKSASLTLFRCHSVILCKNRFWHSLAPTSWQLWIALTRRC